MAKCELCDNEGVKSAIIREFYYKSLCFADYDFLVKNEAVSSGQAEYNRGRDHEDHLADVIQPYNGDGSISQEFLKLYPEQSAKMFSREQIDHAERS